MKPREFLRIMSTAEKLKCNTRHSWTSNGRKESVADHSWRLSFMAMLVADEFPEADINKVIQMCIVHDLGEAITGDIPSFEKTEKDTEQEDALRKEWVASFPEPFRSECAALFEEMDGQISLEAKIYKALDKLEAVIQHNEADLTTWLPLEYDLQLSYGTEQVAFSDYFIKLKEEINRCTREKIMQSQGNDLFSIDTKK